MKALTIRQPWAWLIMHGGKNVENRQWHTEYRGVLAIHAGKGMSDGEYMDCYVYAKARGVTIPPAEELKFGQILGTVRVIDCVARPEDIPGAEFAGVTTQWFEGPWGIVMVDPKPLNGTLHTRGNLGLWPVSMALEQLISEK